MIKKVFKYSITASDVTGLSMPKGAEILTIQTQKGQPQLWALVDPDAEQVIRVFQLVGTGHPVEVSDFRSDLKYINSFQLNGGDLVFHLFEVLP